MIFGVLAGELLALGPEPRRQSSSPAVGRRGLLGRSARSSTRPSAPIVKRIWTPSWVVASTGWTCWMLAAFYWVIDVAGYRRWSFPLVVVGMNSIAIYLMSQLMKPFVAASLRTHFGPDIFSGPVRPAGARAVLPDGALADLPVAVPPEDLHQDLKGGRFLSAFFSRASATVCAVLTAWFTAFLTVWTKASLILTRASL